MNHTNLRDELEWVVSAMRRRQGHPMGDLSIDSQAVDKLEAIVLRFTQQERVEELKTALDVLGGFGSQGDKTNGNPHFMNGIETAEEYLFDRIEELEALQDKKS